MLHGHVPANTRKIWACFQALWLGASCLTLGISVPQLEAGGLFCMASPGLVRYGEVRMGHTVAPALRGGWSRDHRTGLKCKQCAKAPRMALRTLLPCSKLVFLQDWAYCWVDTWSASWGAAPSRHSELPTALILLYNSVEFHRFLLILRFHDPLIP